MNEIGNKEKIINILEKFESGLTYKNLLQRYKEEYGNELKECYVYLKRLKEKNIIESYKAQNTIGKILTYKLTAKALTREPDDSETKLEKLIGLVSDLIKEKSISNNQEKELVDICQL